MRLNELLQPVNHSSSPVPDVEVVSVTEDSRRSVPGAVFVAAPGEHVDGHSFAGRAVAAGAVAIVGARSDLTELEGVPYFYTANPRKFLGEAAHKLLGDPSRFMKVIGITGTNGKTSSVTLTRHILEACGRKTACFGTIGYVINGEILPAAHTTPFAEELAGMFQQAYATQHSHVVMEVSSHSIDQERIAGIHFAGASFTNLTQDHLDYYHDMETYRRAKLRLFERIEGPGAFTVVNQEDPSASYFINASQVPCYSYGKGGACQASKIRTQINATTFTVETPWGTADICMKLLGNHNVSNALGVIAICGALGIPIDAIAEAISTMPCVPGRFEHVDEGQKFQVIVDYAHTDDGLRNVLSAAQEICKGRIITVFGCGGDRDKTKRPKMAAVAAKYSSFCVITSDNPRTEDPDRILLDIESGIQHAGKKKGGDYVVIADRAEAIQYALSMAKPADLVMIAGKGHETYQIIGTERLPFDDREVARRLLKGVK